MQTFLPHPNFVTSVQCLDYRRLGKQRVEARQIQRALQEGGGWSSHPCCDMWRNHITALMLYGDCCIREWVRRGYNNTMPLMLTTGEDRIPEMTAKVPMPDWLGDEDFHASHRSNLLRKDPEFYSKFGWTESPDLEYIWPKG